MTMRRLLGILLLMMLTNVVSATDESINSNLVKGECKDCDDELDDELNEIDMLENVEELIQEERQKRPPRRPFCERPRRGWGGKCTEFTMDLQGYRCDFFWNNTDNLRGKRLCYDDNQACCVDCKSKAQQEICWKKRNFSTARGYCCDNELQVTEKQDSGCVCCKHCKRKRLCRHPGPGLRGFCVTDHDPRLNTTMCTDQGGRLKKRACMGIGCWCCVVPIPTETPTH